MEPSQEKNEGALPMCCQPHAYSPAPESEQCVRCGGLTVMEALTGGAPDSPGWEVTVRRCILCGDIVDPVILAHRKSLLLAQPHGKPGAPREPVR